MLFDDWEFNVLGVYNFRRSGHLKYYFDYCERVEKENLVPGDFCEFGVFRGSSLLGLALMLKELGSSRKVIGFDTWKGFPSTSHPKDQFNQWEILLAEGNISRSHYDKVIKNRRHVAASKPMAPDGVSGLSTSGDFSSCSIEDLQRKIDYLRLDNIELVQGDFTKTLTKYNGVTTLAAAIIDCDLYEGYVLVECVQKEHLAEFI